MKIWKIGLLVEDYDKAKDYYVNVLGLAVIDENPRAIHLDGGPVRIELIRKEVFEGDPNLGNPGFHHISFKVDDIESKSSELKSKGVAFIKEPFEIVDNLKLAFFDGLNGVNLQLFDDKR